MNIHALNTFSGSVSSSTYLAIDNGTETTKIGADSVGVTAEMTQSEATTGASTSKRVITPSVFKSAVTSLVNTLVAPMISAFTDRFVLHTGTVTTSTSGTASFSTTYNTSEYACLSVWATGAVDGCFLAPYKYGVAAGGRWGFVAKTSGSLNPIASTSIAYAALLYKYN